MDLAQVSLGDWKTIIQLFLSPVSYQHTLETFLHILYDLWCCLIGSGCKECECTGYALDSTCDDNGKCTCKPGIQGDTCDTCQHKYVYLLLL